MENNDELSESAGQITETVISATDIDQQGSNTEAQRKGDSLRCLVVPNHHEQTPTQMSEVQGDDLQHRGIRPESKSGRHGAMLPVPTHLDSGLSADKERKKKKSRAFFERLLAKRQQPGNCVRCGHKNPELKYKTCPRCREAVARRKKAAAEKPTVTTRALERRVESLELAVVNLQMSHAKIYARAYNSGKKAALKPHRKYFDAYPLISKQELSKINHAY